MAPRLGHALSRLMDGRDVTTDLFNRRGQADLDRIDKLNRNIVRDVDHQYWLKQRGHHAAFVRQGERIAAYAYGGRDQVGPVAGTTREAAICALGWAINLASEAAERGRRPHGADPGAVSRGGRRHPGRRAAVSRPP